MDASVKEIGERLRAAAREIGPSDPDWPARLRDSRSTFPARLWVAGTLPDRAVAIVGSRRPDLGGLRAARALAAELARAGFAVVSGGAPGIDTAAHEGALEAGGRTVVVLGSGLARPYPTSGASLFERAAAAGAVVSPFPPDTAPLPAHFVRRNRVLAALGEAVVVVRAAARSGALSTVDWAVRLGRPVLAVPGSTTCSCAAGSNDLLRRGAIVAIDASDVVRALDRQELPRIAPLDPPPVREAEREEPALEPGDPLLALLAGGEPAEPESIVEVLGWAPAETAARLGRLEAEGRVVRLPDGRFRTALAGG